MKLDYKEPNKDEKNLRFNNIINEMKRHDIYALIIGGNGHWWTGRGYFRYLTDFHLWGHDGLIYFPIDDDPTLVLTSSAVARKIQLRGWIKNCYGDLFLGDKLISLIDKEKVKGKKISIIGGDNIISYNNYKALVEGLNDSIILEKNNILDKIKMSKTAWEIEQIYNLWELAKHTINLFESNVLNYSKQNKTKIQLSTDITSILWENGIRDLLIFYGDEIGKYYHPNNDQIKVNDKIRYHLEICGPSGHWLEITKNLSFKKIKNYESKLMKDELDIFQLMLNYIKEGVTLKQAGDFYKKCISDFNYPVELSNSFDFHGQGLDTIEKPYYNCMVNNESENWFLKENICLSYHPKKVSIKDNMWSTGINEDILVQKDKSVRFSKNWNHNWIEM